MAKAIQIDGKKFASLRQKHLKTQAEIAKSLGVTVGRVVGIESKERVGMYARNFRTLSEVFGVTPDELLKQIGAAAEPSPIVAVPLARDLYEKALTFAEAQGVAGDKWIAAAIEALMRLQGSPEESAKGKHIAGRIEQKTKGRLLVTPTKRVAAKNLDKEK
jgi:transcriptional regulator with XRE-family HTH domain